MLLKQRKPNSVTCVENQCVLKWKLRNFTFLLVLCRYMLYVNTDQVNSSRIQICDMDKTSASSKFVTRLLMGWDCWNYLLKENPCKLSSIFKFNPLVRLKNMLVLKTVSYSIQNHLSILIYNGMFSDEPQNSNLLQVLWNHNTPLTNEIFRCLISYWCCNTTVLHFFKYWVCHLRWNGLQSS